MQVAILGCGVIGPVHAQALALDRRVAIRWCIDPLRDRAEALAVRHGARASADPQDALGDPAVDLVCVCTPHHTHAELACAALAAGKHVVIEKPLATTPADLDRILAAARRRPELVAAGIFQHRHAPVVRRLAELLAAGAFGPVTQASVDFRCTRDAAYYASGTWRGTWAGEGGSLLINQGIHTIDLLTVLLGEPVSVSAEVERRRAVTAECEDHARLRVEYPHPAGSLAGPVGTITCTNDGIAGWYARVTVGTALGGFTLDENERFTDLRHPNAALVSELTALALMPQILPASAKLDYGIHHANQLADVVSAIAAGHRPLVDVAAAAVTNGLVLAAYHSVAVGAAVRLADLGQAYRSPDLLTSSIRPRTPDHGLRTFPQTFP